MLNFKLLNQKKVVLNKHTLIKDLQSRNQMIKELQLLMKIKVNAIGNLSYTQLMKIFNKKAKLNRMTLFILSILRTKE
jgi:hypothetical protein